MKTQSIKGLIVLHVLPNNEHDELVLINPAAGTNFAKLEMGEECAIGEEVTVNGHLLLDDTTEGLAQLDLFHSFKQDPLSELWVLSKTAEHLETSFDGEFYAYLSGSHFGLNWSGEAA